MKFAALPYSQEEPSEHIKHSAISASTADAQCFFHGPGRGDCE